MTDFEFILQLIDTERKQIKFAEKHVYFIEHPEKLEALWQVITSDLAHPYPEYAAWWWSHLGAKMPEKILKFQQEMIRLCTTSKNQSVLRSVLKAMVDIQRPEENSDLWLENQIQIIEDDWYNVATKVYAAYNLAKWKKEYPELMHEIAELLALKVEKGATPALKMAHKNFLRMVNTTSKRNRK